MRLRNEMVLMTATYEDRVEMLNHAREKFIYYVKQYRHAKYYSENAKMCFLENEYQALKTQIDFMKLPETLEKLTEVF
jgi:hypothetical protein